MKVLKLDQICAKKVSHQDDPDSSNSKHNLIISDDTFSN